MATYDDEIGGAPNTTRIGDQPMSLRMAMQKYADGGDVAKSKSSTLTPYNFNVGKSSTIVDIPGVGPTHVYWDHEKKRVVVSDEGYWNPKSPVGESLDKAVKWARDLGYQAGVVVSPYASDRFGDGETTTAGGHTRAMPGATDDQLREYVDAADFVVVDPYAVSGASATPDVLNNFASFTKNVGDYAESKGKDSWLVLQGFTSPDVDPKTVDEYNRRLINENAGRYGDLSYFNVSDFGNEGRPDESAAGLTQLDIDSLNNYAQQVAQPFRMAESIDYDLPNDWNSYTPQEKINWYNTNNVNASQLQSAGVTQPDIDWMAQNGYLGATQQTPPQAQTMQSAGGMGGGNLFNTPNEITGLLSNIGYPEIPEEKQLPDTANPTDNLINRLGYGV
jgi:hypothetical protein